jgi:formate dehydrogenase subunit gamma
MSRARHVVIALLGVLACTAALAQDKLKVEPLPAAPAASTAASSPDLVPPGTGGIQSQNIFDVKPQVKPDASSDPKYKDQTNGQRNAVQPGNNAPMWRNVEKGMAGYSSLPRSEAPEAGVLIQAPVQYPGSRMTTAGEAWRQVRNTWLIPYGGALLLIVLGAIALYYFTKGPMGHHGVGEGPHRIERFTPFERSAHWSNAIAFSILMISGLVMGWGKFFILPVIGGALYGPLTWLLKSLHNFAGPVFAVSLLIMFFTFLRDNFPQRGDLNWLLKGGGMFGKSSKEHREPPSNRFNAGEKIVFWFGMLVCGFFVVASGLTLDKLLPGITYDRQTMQIAHMFHNASTVVMMCVFFGHIYIGTIGMKGAYTAMRRGWVGDEWAREHHLYWYEDIAAGKIPAERSRRPLVAANDPERPRAA